MGDIHGVVQTVLLIVITIFTVGRWSQARESKESAATKDNAALTKELAECRAADERAREAINRELERQRRRWHDELTPWRQKVAEMLARFEEHEKAQDIQIGQLWATSFNRRHESRE